MFLKWARKRKNRKRKKSNPFRPRDEDQGGRIPASFFIQKNPMKIDKSPFERPISVLRKGDDV